MLEVEEAILECIRVAHLGLQLLAPHYRFNLFLHLQKLLKIQPVILKTQFRQPIFLVRPMNQKPKLHYTLPWLHPMQLSLTLEDCFSSRFKVAPRPDGPGVSKGNPTGFLDTNYEGGRGPSGP